MSSFITKTNLSLGIRFATLDDLPAIQQLNAKWAAGSPTVIDKQHGFLDCAPFAAACLQKIIAAGETGVATHDGNVVAYYVTDNQSGQLEEYQAAIAKMKQAGALPRDARISQRTQIVVDSAFQNLGIPRAMLHFLRPVLEKKYDFLFSIGLNENPKKAAHQKAGWSIIYEDESEYFCAYSLTGT